MVVAATGFFDGVHTGHKAVLQAVRDTSVQMGAESAIITFWPHPRNVLQQDASSLRLLNTIEEKKSLIREFGIDEVHVVPFTRDFSRMTASCFIREYLMEKFGVAALVLGYDHRLGSENPTREELASIAAGCGLKVIQVEEVDCNGTPVSSTKIRKLIEAGDVAAAARLLGYSYRLHGVVVSGDRIGRTIGFPTANIQLYEPLKILPGNGVYRVKVTFQGKNYVGVCNIGERPTVACGKHRTIETYILDFDEEIYGLDLHLEFMEKIRDEIRFDSLEELKCRISKDVESVAGAGPHSCM